MQIGNPFDQQPIAGGVASMSTSNFPKELNVPACPGATDAALGAQATDGHRV